ncbi:MAG: DUF1178 family protein [Acidovorax sp.]|jgi:hypothetical protein|nr:DUF1178 family protein [Acidovorax sp.]
MKVFDLHCDQGHVFEGWFGSEGDFQNQLARDLIACPVCNSVQVRKGLSAPRLNLGATPVQSAATASESIAPTPAPAAGDDRLRALQAAWLQMSRRIAQQTEDVGAGFADEARRIHRGEVEERGIRGQATPREAMELLDEGIGVLPLALPDGAKETLQ